MVVLVAVMVAGLVWVGVAPRRVRRLAPAADGSVDFARIVGEVRDQVARRMPGRIEKRRSASVELINGFTAELRAGQPIRQAFIRAHDACEVPIAADAVAMAKLGGDVPKALRAASEQDGLDVLRSLAALWSVAEGSGAGLAQAADRLAVSAAAAQAARHELKSQLTGPRATARVLAGLPIFGLLMGAGLGASPVEWLLTPPWGFAVLIAGIGLEVAGLWWISRLTKSVESLI